MELNDWLAIIGAFGGLEAVRWGVTFWVNRKTNARKEDASADSMEDENERKQVDWLEERTEISGSIRVIDLRVHVHARKFPFSEPLRHCFKPSVNSETAVESDHHLGGHVDLIGHADFRKAVFIVQRDRRERRVRFTVVKTGYCVGYFHCFAI